MREVSFRALALYAQLLARKFRIQVVFHDAVETAATNGKQIVIGARYKKIGTQKDARVLFGLVAHEAMHLRYSDFDLRPEVRNLMNGKNVELLKRMWNVAEDVWGERKFCEVFPGVWGDIIDSMEVMREMGLYGPPKFGAPKQPATIFMSWWLAHHLGAHYKASFPAMWDDALAWQSLASKTFGQKLVDQMLALMQGIAQVESTLGAWEYAARGYELLMQAQQASQDDSSGESEESGQPSAEDADQTPSGSDPQDQKPDASTPPASGNEKGSSEQGGEDGPGTGNSADHTDDEPGEGDDAPGSSGSSSQGGSPTPEQIAQAVAGVLDASEQLLSQVVTEKGDALKKNEESGTTLSPMELSSIADLKVWQSSKSNDPVKHEVLAEAAAIRRRLQGRLEPLLAASVDILPDTRRTGVRISSPKLASIRTGNLNIFDHLEVGEDLDTVIQVVMDSSGSMHRIWNPTMASMIAIGDVLETYQVPFGVLNFSTAFERHKAISDRWALNRGRAPTFFKAFTDTANAIQIAALDLMAHQASRRIGIILTDGDSDSDPAALAVAQECRTAGIDLAFVFLGEQGMDLQKMLKNHGFAVCRTDGTSLATANAIESSLAECISPLKKAA